MEQIRKILLKLNKTEKGFLDNIKVSLDVLEQLENLNLIAKYYPTSPDVIPLKKVAYCQ